jgi:lipoprotein-anchoring transpeptidase ErfK/SrfK
VRHRSFIAVASLLAALAAVAVAVVMLDARAKDHIARGVKVGGVDVGGLTPAAARAKLHTELLAPLQAPITVHHGSKTWTLSAARARISADVDGMVDAAVARSREGNPFSRAVRQATGGHVDARLPADVSFSRAAVHRLVARIEGAVNRQPVDAKIDYRPSGLGQVESKSGLAVRAQALEDQIDATVAKPGAERRFVARTRKIHPKVTTSQLADKYPAIIIVDRSSFRLRLFKHLKLTKTYPIAVGQQGLETPAGLYDVQNKQVNPSWHVPNSAWAGKLAGQVIPPGPADPLKARWMGFNGGAGIHGTDADASIGSAASHGCIRMHIPDVIDLYDQVSVGSPVYVA